MEHGPGRTGDRSLRERLDDVIVVRSLTKAASIPGLRAGYAIAPPALAERLRAVRPPWSANALALAALAAAADHPAELAAIAERAAAERARPGRAAGWRRGRAQLAFGGQLLPARGGRRPGGARARCASAGSRCARRPPSPASGRVTCGSPRATPPENERPWRRSPKRVAAERLGMRDERGTARLVGIGADGWAGSARRRARRSSRRTR